MVLLKVAHYRSPQGAWLSPLLFDIYLESVLRAAEESLTQRPVADLHVSEKTAFADDVNRYSTDSTYLENCKPILTEKLKEWWRVVLNAEKIGKFTLSRARGMDMR
jgi:hypothetical protein